MRFIVSFLLLTAALAAQDKVTITVQRGTVTRTATIDAAAATEAMKALDYYVSTQAGRVAHETAALHELVATLLLGQIRVTPGTAIKAANEAEAAARTNRENLEAAFLKAAGAVP